MPLAQVAIIGRPNVGKSSIFNFLSERRLAIVEKVPGVTLDRVGTVIEHDDCRFELIDTGGMGLAKDNVLATMMEEQIYRAIEKADVLVMVVDAQTGIAPLDRQVAEALRKKHRKPILVANKVDDDVHESLAADFYSLGFGEPILVSTTVSRGKGRLIEAIINAIPEEKRGAHIEDVDGIMLAVVGKRNTGKSTLVNALVGEERMIVSDIPGTTRDSVDVRFRFGDKTFLVIDTAGIRRRTQLKDSVEYFSSHRALRSIRRCDVVIFALDVSIDISAVDKKLARYIIEENKPCVILVNKWDKAQDVIETTQFHKYLEEKLPGMYYQPVLYTSGKEKINLDAIIETASSLYEQANATITTGVLNRIVQEAVSRRSIRIVKGKEGKIFYATQTASAPPTITLFVKNKSLFKDGYLRYLTNYIRNNSPFGEIPLRLVLREHKKDEELS